MKQLADAMWNAGLKEDETKDQMRSARRRKAPGIILALGAALLPAWRSSR